MSDMPSARTISVVVAVRNGARTLQRCLDSVFEQRLSGVELVVMDGGSTDGTQAIIERNASRIAYWASGRDGGVYDAWNKALPHTRGDWICFLGSDDRFSGPDVLSRIDEALTEARDRYRVAYAALNIVDARGTTVGAEGRPWEEIREEFRTGMVLPHPATFHHRSLFAQHGGFDERFKIAGDYELLLRELLDRDPLFVPNLVVVDMAAGGISDRPESDGTRAREKHRARHMHGLTSVPEWRAPEVIRAVVRAWLARTFGRRAANSMRDAYRAVRSRFGRTADA
jgi:glycosyltransferase involved in cell wall biosynthesis